jgi:hypothetical protein
LLIVVMLPVSPPLPLTPPYLIISAIPKHSS